MKLGKRPRPAMPRTNTVKEFSSDQMAVDPTPPAVANHHTAFSAHFLTACSLCKRRLIPGRDIYMYRGDTGFCSQECREQQIKRDERKEKCSVFASKRKGAGAAAATSAAAATGPNGVANPSAAV